MSTTYQAVRGMKDVLPEATPRWRWVQSLCEKIASQYAYHEIRFPCLESTALYQRSIGEVTDIVSKEMYTFDDRNGDSLTLRPEGTAGCVRAAIQNGLVAQGTQKLWYCGDMFRHERPQKGRYRQFAQFGVEALGQGGVAQDAEVILLSYDILCALGLGARVTLHLNTLGSAASRERYKTELVAYFSEHTALLGDDEQTRLSRNPLRLLDSKNPDLQDIIKSAPKLIDSLDADERANFDVLCQLLTDCGVEVLVDHAIVRGLDYYNDTVFEWVTDDLGAQGTVCAGGRYDGLVEQLGGKSTPAIGFAMGLERLQLLTEADQPDARPASDLFVVVGTESGRAQALRIASRCREALASVVEVDGSGAKMKAQFKRADKSGAQYALVIGDDEVAHNTVTLKPLREEGEQVTLSVDDLLARLQKEQSCKNN